MLGLLLVDGGKNVEIRSVCCLHRRSGVVLSEGRPLRIFQNVKLKFPRPEEKFSVALGPRTAPITPPSLSPPPPPVARTGDALPPALRASRAQALRGRVTCRRLINFPCDRPLFVIRGSSMEMVLSERKYLFDCFGERSSIVWDWKGGWASKGGQVTRRVEGEDGARETKTLYKLPAM